jgi:putative nucleotidyltransferase with HDIG domain
MTSDPQPTHPVLSSTLPVALLNSCEQADVHTLLDWMAAVGCVTEDGHPHRVMSLTLHLAEGLSLLGSAITRRTAIRAGLLHDVGKSLVPITLINKPGPLSAAERRVIEQHAPLGARLAASYPGIETDVLDAVRHHHEHYNGHGYPSGLIGREIPQLARILSVADVYDALTSDRPYRAAWNHEEASQHLQQHVGEMFDPQVVATFVALTGSLPLC